MKIKSFKSVVSKYKVVYFDAFGVLKNYQGIIEGIDRTFEYLKERDIDFYILTNDASRSPEQLAEVYQNAGIKDVTSEKIISSGMLARQYLRYKVRNGTVAYLGTTNSAHYLRDLGLETVSISDVSLDDMEDIGALVFLDDEGFDWNTDINKTVNLLRRKNIPVVVANTDTAYPLSKKDIAVAIGGLADMVERIVGKRFIRFGKPDAQMFIFAYEHVMKNRKVSRRDMLMVGDTLDTDILGGNKFGLDTTLVLSGNTLSDQVGFKIKSSGIIPTYICDSVVL